MPVRNVCFVFPSKGHYRRSLSSFLLSLRHRSSRKSFLITLQYPDLPRTFTQLKTRNTVRNHTKHISQQLLSFEHVVDYGQISKLDLLVDGCLSFSGSISRSELLMSGSVAPLLTTCIGLHIWTWQSSNESRLPKSAAFVFKSLKKSE